MKGAIYEASQYLTYFKFIIKYYTYPILINAIILVCPQFSDNRICRI